MSAPEDGGPAFPFNFNTGEWNASNVRSPGMTLRDYFAAAAMTVAADDLRHDEDSDTSRSDLSHELTAGDDVFVTPENVAELSYKFADAMLAARERKT